MSGAVITVTGISNVKREITQKLGLLDTQLDSALMRGGMIVEGRAKEICPVDTGRLRGSITTHAGEAEDESTHVVCVGTNVEYASYVEFGTGLRGEGGSGTTRYSMGGGMPHAGMSAQPYLRPALDECREDVVQEIKETIKEILK